MKPEIFSSADDGGAQGKFQQWQAINPNGLYINKKGRSRGMLHRVGCSHVGGPGDWDAGFGDVAKRAKVCHRDRAFLLTWAKHQEMAVSFCSDCKP